MERLVIKSKDGRVHYYDAERGLKLESYEVAPHQRRKVMERLYAYEDTGFTPPEIMELKERDTAVLLEDIVANKKDNGRLLFGTCPKCKRRVSDVEGGNFCQNCGQRLKWEE